MCIINDSEMLKKEKVGTGQLQLWKVIDADNSIGLWSDTRENSFFGMGVNRATNWPAGYYKVAGSGQFHCFFSRQAARKYREHHCCRSNFCNFTPTQTKIIKVYASRKDIVAVGMDEITDILCISVSKLKIKSLKHQR